MLIYGLIPSGNFKHGGRNGLCLLGEKVSHMACFTKLYLVRLSIQYKGKDHIKWQVFILFLFFCRNCVLVIGFFLASKGDAMLFLIKGFMKYKKDLNTVLDHG